MGKYTRGSFYVPSDADFKNNFPCYCSEVCVVYWRMLFVNKRIIIIAFKSIFIFSFWDSIWLACGSVQRVFAFAVLSLRFTCQKFYSCDYLKVILLKINSPPTGLWQYHPCSIIQYLQMRNFSLFYNYQSIFVMLAQWGQKKLPLPK